MVIRHKNKLMEVDYIWIGHEHDGYQLKEKGKPVIWYNPKSGVRNQILEIFETYSDAQEAFDKISDRLIYVNNQELDMLNSFIDYAIEWNKKKSIVTLERLKQIAICFQMKTK